MKKHLIFFLAISWLSYGQQATVGIQSTRALKAGNALEAEQVCQKIKEVLLDAGTYEVLDREALGYVLDEQEIQKQITSINADVVEQGRIKGAEFIIASKLFNATYKDIGGLKVLGKTNLTRAILSFSVDILDTETGATVNSEKFSIGTLSDNTGGITEEEALRAALNSKSLNKKLRQFLVKSGGGAVKLISIEEENGDGSAKIVLINVGSGANAKKNMKYGVYELSTMTIDGENVNREKWVADLKIAAVEGEKLSTAKVDKGGKKLKELFETGATLICKSK